MMMVAAAAPLAAASADNTPFYMQANPLFVNSSLGDGPGIWPSADPFDLQGFPEGQAFKVEFPGPYTVWSVWGTFDEATGILTPLPGEFYVQLFVIAHEPGTYTVTSLGPRALGQTASNQIYA
ncbi:hypothetical protein [Tessaracoccus caeni]|uniref:hypothetical protein n=1 Tax=Tessaracoccus caeni TaxID=3031239 RepID=UPI0023DCC376|nr:hypothetical protein [Tessaracoccus caeni]MDF1488426.1 hypothetical protein [Tessaracoccus caeni]